MSLILGIETSCDETAASVVENGEKVLSSVVASQIAQHADYGGVVPELAAREHLKAMEPVVGAALREAGKEIGDIDAVGVTNGPGLMPALLVGINFAKGISAANNIPLLGVNHFIAHIYGTFLDSGVEILKKTKTFPLLALVVSGGHTALVLISDDGKARLVGTTLDDAAGEAFDKAAKLLNIGYPGGPIIEKTALKGDSRKYKFPRSLTGRTGKGVDEKNRFNFSFSGVKTSLLYHCEKLGGGENMEGELLYDTVASYQEAIVDALCIKALDAARHFKASSIVLCGGVACNTLLRSELSERAGKDFDVHVSPKKYCTDNAAMVAGLAFHLLNKGVVCDLALDAYARLPEISDVPFSS